MMYPNHVKLNQKDAQIIRMDKKELAIELQPNAITHYIPPSWQSTVLNGGGDHKSMFAKEKLSLLTLLTFQ